MNFVNQHFNKIVLGLLLVLFMQECNNSSKLNSLEKKSKAMGSRLDSVCTTAELKSSLEIEGLKSEKRMIQSTDRTILDVNRQAEIDKALKKLEK
jgi:hypothetical protein